MSAVLVYDLPASHSVSWSSGRMANMPRIAYHIKGRFHPPDPDEFHEKLQAASAGIADV